MENVQRILKQLYRLNVVSNYRVQYELLRYLIPGMCIWHTLYGIQVYI